jgi:hypothetical protein
MNASVMNELERIDRKDLYNEILKYESEQTEKQKYNGWSNYETWCVNLWIENDEGLNDTVIDFAIDIIESSDGKDEAIRDLSKKIESEIDEFTPELKGMFADLLTSALSSVDYYEIAEHYIDDNWADKETMIKIINNGLDYFVYIEKDDQNYEMNLDSSPSGVNMCVDSVDGDEYDTLWEGSGLDLDDSDLPDELIANIKKRL